MGISSSEELKLIRDLRNEISHEYRLDDITEIFEEVFEYTEKLIEIVEKTKEFVAAKKLVNCEFE